MVYVLLMNFVEPCVIGCKIFSAETEVGVAMVMRYMSVTACFGCCDILVIVSPGFGEGNVYVC